jgi:hypothetical protein
MTNLHKAIGDISSIRRQVARSTEFQGYGPATLAATGVSAMLAAAVQAQWLPEPATHIALYLAIWTSTAIVSAALIGTEMFARTRRIHSGLADEMIRMAVEQFLPSAGAGALLTFVLIHYVPSASWMLPGMWQIIYSLGIFSSCRFLPRLMIAPGVWYMVTGMGSISLAGNRALSPWTMGIAFGVGQLLVAAALLFHAPEADDEN